LRGRRGQREPRKRRGPRKPDRCRFFTLKAEKGQGREGGQGGRGSRGGRGSGGSRGSEETRGIKKRWETRETRKIIFLASSSSLSYLSKLYHGGFKQFDI
jgi:hypothetical protein